jgi:hypothetical protein
VENKFSSQALKSLRTVIAVLMLSLGLSFEAYAACSTPSGVAGEVILNSGGFLQYCNNSSWVTFPGKVSNATPTVVYLTTTGAGSWTVPSDWNPSNNKIEVIGGGGGGSTTSGVDGAGGGGGAYAKSVNLNLTPGASVSYSIGSGGGPNANGGDTWFNATSLANAVSNGAAVSVGAQGGRKGNDDNMPDPEGVGGQASASVGVVVYSGGDGADEPDETSSGSGGGGAGGPHGPGAVGGPVSLTPYAADVGGGGGGGAGGGTTGSAATNSTTGMAGGTNWQGSGSGAGGTYNN